MKAALRAAASGARRHASAYTLDVAGDKNVKRTMRLMPFEARLEFVTVLRSLMELRKDKLLEANQKDCEAFSDGLDPTSENVARAERMYITEEKHIKMRQDLHDLTMAQDYNGSLSLEWETQNRVNVQKKRTPRGRIAVMAGPDPLLTLHSMILPLFVGNAVTLKPSKDLSHTAATLAGFVSEAMSDTGIPTEALEMCATRADFTEVLSCPSKVDLVISMGSRAAADFARGCGAAPVLTLNRTSTHAYIHSDAEPVQVGRILTNALLQSPGSPTSVDHLLVHKAYTQITSLLEALNEGGVEFHRDARGQRRLDTLGFADLPGQVVEGGDAPGLSSGGFQGKSVSIRFVGAMEEAVEVTNAESSGHIATILCKLDSVAEEFVNLSDASQVFHNTSPLLGDSEGLGLGPGLGISNGLIGGPISPRELLDSRYVVSSIGRTRPAENLKANPIVTHGSRTTE